MANNLEKKNFKIEELKEDNEQRKKQLPGKEQEIEQEQTANNNIHSSAVASPNLIEINSNIFSKSNLQNKNSIAYIFNINETERSSKPVLLHHSKPDYYSNIIQHFQSYQEEEIDL